MLESIKKGFGMTVGATLAYLSFVVLGRKFMKDVISQDDKFMESLKETDPKTYNMLAKYRKKEKES